MSAFLDVERSIRGRVWIDRSETLGPATKEIQRASGLPLELCRVLALHGVPADGARAHLDPKLRTLLPDPHSLKDMQAAAARILEEVRRGGRIVVFADYDVDGATAGAQLICWLRELGCAASHHVPHRIKEGYGPNEETMRRLAESHDLIVCVDCGAQASEAIAAAEGADVVVLDHHACDAPLPEAVAFVNPNRHDESGDLGHLCAAGVVFLAIVEANRQLRDSGQEPPDARKLLDLVALGTVADLVPLQGVNRAFVRGGLKLMAQRNRIGLAALMDAAKADDVPDEGTLGFALGPRINAGGRIGRPDLGLRLLTCEDRDEASAIADEIERLNLERREIEEGIRHAAHERAEARGFERALVWAADESWHPGLVGIVAARLRDAANRPAVVIGSGGKGSGRSTGGPDMGRAVRMMAAEGLLRAGGGHPRAVGLTVEPDRIDEAMQRLEALMEEAGAIGPGRQELMIDSLIAPEAATAEMIAQIDSAGPYGARAPRPRHAFAGVRICHAGRTRGDHLFVRFEGAGGGRRIPAIAFNAWQTRIGPALENAHMDDRFNLAGVLEVNTWKGRREAKLRIEDAAPAV